MNLLIDADSLIYRAGFAAEKTLYLVEFGDNIIHMMPDAKVAKETAKDDGLGGGNVWSRKDLKSEDEAKSILSSFLSDITSRYPDYTPELWLSPPSGNFREKLATRAKYKGNREFSQKPTHFKALKQFLIDRGAKETVGQEADDQISIRAHESQLCVIAHIDKDLDQIPGTHFNYVKKEEYTVSKMHAAINFWEQVLTGDVSDNVPGIPGIGPAKAKKILEGAKNNYECWGRVLKAYAAARLAPTDAHETARLVYLRTMPGEVWSAPKAPEDKQDAA